LLQEAMIIKFDILKVINHIM